MWPTATGWFADEDIFAMDIWDYSPANRDPLPVRNAADPVHLRRHRRHRADAEIGIDETRAHVNKLNHRLLDGLDELRAASRRRASATGAARCSACAPPTRLPSSRRCAATGIVTSERDGNVRISAHAYNGVEDVDAVLARWPGTGGCSPASRGAG